MRNINEPQEFYAIADENGNWWESNCGPYKTLKGAQRETRRFESWGNNPRVVKMIPMFFDVETGERITALPEGMI